MWYFGQLTGSVGVGKDVNKKAGPKPCLFAVPFMGFRWKSSDSYFGIMLIITLCVVAEADINSPSSSAKGENRSSFHRG